jgi:two-component system sensor histidine kinase GlrK
MKLTIFSRLVIGYLAIFILAMAVIIYAISQLRQLENISHSILSVDIGVLTYDQKLTDILLSLIRYEKKFVVDNDVELYDQFLMKKDEFDFNLKQVVMIADVPETKKLLNNVEKYFQRYQSLFDIEVEFLKAGQEYPVANYKKEKELAVNGILDNLKQLKTHSQGSTYNKIKKLGEAEVNASKVAIVMGLISLVTGIVISIFITINITRPLSEIKKRTGEIARGDFPDDLKLESPPEITELANAFNIMCAKLKQIDKLKSDFFSLMSHELRTPLTTIKEGTNLMIEGMENGKSSGKQKRLLTIISEESNRLINLVNSLLDLSKMEAGMMAYNFTPTDIGVLINKVSREIEPLAETRDIKIHTDINSGSPLIKMDRDRMLQVLRNLIGNAVKFTPDGGDVKVCSRSVDAGVNVSIEDTGAGIPGDNLSTIFNKYEQVTLGGSSKIKGTGLGLSIVKHIIDAHGGKIWVKSTLGQGSVFSFVLPVSSQS